MVNNESDATQRQAATIYPAETHEAPAAMQDLKNGEPDDEDLLELMLSVPYSPPANQQPTQRTYTSTRNVDPKIGPTDQEILNLADPVQDQPPRSSSSKKHNPYKTPGEIDEYWGPEGSSDVSSSLSDEDEQMEDRQIQHDNGDMKVDRGKHEPLTSSSASYATVVDAQDDAKLTDVMDVDDGSSRSSPLSDLPEDEETMSPNPVSKKKKPASAQELFRRRQKRELIRARASSNREALEALSSPVPQSSGGEEANLSPKPAWDTQWTNVNGVTIDYPPYTLGTAKKRKLAQKIIREDNPAEVPCKSCSERDQICYRTRKPGVFRCAYCKTNSRISAKACAGTKLAPSGFPGSPLTELPTWAIGDEQLKAAARAIIQENYIAAEPCGACTVAGVTCYRSRNPAKVKCAYCRTSAHFKVADCAETFARDEGTGSEMEVDK